MATVYLMRHGQASFGSDDYDQLSPTGVAQAEFNGRLLASLDKVPDRIVHGTLKRQRQSVEGLLNGFRAAGVASLPEVLEQPDWNEFDHQGVIQVHGVHAGDLRELIAASDDKETTFARYFVAAMTRWVECDDARAGEAGYRESYRQFENRVDNALRAVTSELAGRERVMAVTSGGPISMVAKQLLNMDRKTALELNWRLVNGGLTKVAVSQRTAVPALQLISLNEHMHFSGEHAHLLTAR